MGRPTKMSAIKRQRERDKAEKAAEKRSARAERRTMKDDDDEGGPGDATRADLEGYGVIESESEEA